jgi:Flp pilus assembly protein CpaB
MARAATANNPERTNRLVAIGAVVFAAIAAVLLFVALQSRGDSGGGSPVSTVNAVVAAQSIDANTTLTSDMLKIDAVPANLLLDGSYASTDRVVGLPLRYPVQAGEQVTASKIGASAIKDEKDISYLLKPGQRGFAISADEVSAVGGLLLAGNTVDVIAVFSSDNEGSQRAYTVLQNLTVLSVAQEAQEPVPAAATPVAGQPGSTDQPSQGITGQRPEDIQRQPGARSVTLAVTPEQVQFLAALQEDENATIWLALRPDGDNSKTDFPASNLFPF